MREHYLNRMNNSGIEATLFCFITAILYLASFHCFFITGSQLLSVAILLFAAILTVYSVYACKYSLDNNIFSPIHRVKDVIIHNPLVGVRRAREIFEHSERNKGLPRYEVKRVGVESYLLASCLTGTLLVVPFSQYKDLLTEEDINYLVSKYFKKDALC